MDKKYIVAEISKNWGTHVSDSVIISQKFENVIQTNLERGYELVDWKFNSFIEHNSLNETIVAVFKKIE